MRKINWKRLIICIAIPLAVGGLSALLTRGSMDIFETVNKPPLSPPAWLFPVVWTLLYVLMGIASYLVLEAKADREETEKALYLYGIQLAVNFFWPVLFFSLQRFGFAFVWLVLLWVLILWTLLRFYRIHKTAGYLLIPYLVWVTFAGYLNFGIWLLN
ncbi:MAG: tryptophan-rich sensory protein [Oscillospiraceae bacterium]|nr:tryptophan-rich sensory protein [Oscillospiraceae bacterium]